MRQVPAVSCTMQTSSAQLGFSVVIQKIMNAHLHEILSRWLAGDSLLVKHALVLRGVAPNAW